MGKPWREAKQGKKIQNIILFAILAVPSQESSELLKVQKGATANQKDVGEFLLQRINIYFIWN